MSVVNLSPAQRKLIRKMVRDDVRVVLDAYWTWRLATVSATAVKEQTLQALADAKLVWLYPKRSGVDYYKASAKAKRLYENGEL